MSQEDNEVDWEAWKRCCAEDEEVKAYPPPDLGPSIKKAPTIARDAFSTMRKRKAEHPLEIMEDQDMFEDTDIIDVQCPCCLHRFPVDIGRDPSHATRSGSDLELEELLDYE